MRSVMTAFFAKSILLAMIASAADVQGSGPAFDWGPWQRLPVQADGRRKPLDTLAREALQEIGGRERFRDPDTGSRLSPTAAYLGMLFDWQGWEQPQGPHASGMMGASGAYFGSHGADKWDREPLIPVDGLKLRDALEVADDRRRMSPVELGEAEVHDPNTGMKTPFGIWARKLYFSEDEDYSKAEKREAVELSNKLQSYQTLRMGRGLEVLPVQGDEHQHWLSLADLIGTDLNDQTDPTGDLRKAKEQFLDVRTAYLAGQAESFDEASAALIATLRKLGPKRGEYPSEAIVNLEVTYNRSRPFRFSWILTLIASLSLLVNSATNRKAFRAAGLTALGAALAALIIGLAMRTVLKGSPPVTNLYESVVFAGFGTVLFGMLFGLRSQRQGVLAASLVVATIILALADGCPSVLDPTIRPLPPVLRSNFWLAVHVATIMLSYAAFAGALGIGNVTLGFYLVGSKRREAIKVQSRSTYKILQAGVLLLVVGTFLGAAWADYSWGRFWGWDPKEVWALITLLGYLAILHARYAGWVGTRGLAACSVICFTLVLMTWYGVNFLSGGLHNYGLGGEEGPIYVLAAIALQLLYVLGAIVMSFLWEILRAARPD
ncbi:MAG: cytochrome c biogenesis protein CcsA [Planctomycetota bacterium]